MKQRYYSLQMTIDNQSTPSIFNTFAAASVSISAATQSRGIDDFRSPSPLPQYQKTPTPPPVVKTKTLVGELLLCFHLLNDLLGHHVAVTKSSELSLLTQTLERVQKMEMKSLEVEFYEASPELKAEAARNLQARLRELARVGYLKWRVLEDAIGIADDTRSEPESSDIRPIEGSVSSAPRPGVMKSEYGSTAPITRRTGRIHTTSLLQRSKYQFEADSSDEEMENEIGGNLDALGHTAGRLNALARAIGQEVDGQNKHIDRIIQKASSPFFPWVMTAVLTFLRRAVVWTTKSR